jgi:hypothetical protein
VGEAVTAEKNARDQVAAFAVHVTRRRARPWGDWVGVPARDLQQKLEALDALMTEIGASEGGTE